MEKRKLKLEIYEGDPFGSTCCGPGPQITSLEAAEKFRQMLTTRNETVERLAKEFSGVVDIERTILTPKRWDYPDYVKKLDQEDKPLPYVFINGEVVLTGKFPTYEEFVALLKSRL